MEIELAFITLANTLKSATRIVSGSFIIYLNGNMLRDKQAKKDQQQKQSAKRFETNWKVFVVILVHV